MAAPNIRNVTSIFGKSAAGALTTAAATIVNNPAGSGLVLKINTLVISNVDGASPADVTISYYTQDDIGGTAYKIVNTVTVPADASLVVISKEAPIYLEEDKSMGGLASANGDLEYVVSYEEIS